MTVEYHLLKRFGGDVVETRIPTPAWAVCAVIAGKFYISEWRTEDLSLAERAIEKAHELIGPAYHFRHTNGRVDFDNVGAMFPIAVGRK